MVYSLAIACGVALFAILAAAMFAALEPLWRERRRELLIVAGVLALIAIVKCLLIPFFPGYPRDIFEFLLWGEVMTRNPSHVYDPVINCRYMPGYLYAMWAAVAPARLLYFGPQVTDASVNTLRIMIRFPPIIADFLLGLIVFAWLRIVSEKSPGPEQPRDLGALMLFALNPALMFTSVAWGQNDSVLTLPVMLAMLTASQNNYALAGAAAALAVIIKLQGLIVLPILGLWILLHARIRDWMMSSLAFLATVVVAFAPFQIGRPWNFLVRVIASSAEYFPYTSLNAFNLMALVFGMRIRDSTALFGLSAFSIGMLLMGGVLLIALFIVWCDRSPRGMLYAAFLAYLGFFVLPTRIHERYLFFAVALLSPLALDSWATMVMFATLTVTFLANQIITLRLLDNIITVHQHDSYASTFAVLNLGTLVVAIIYGFFTVSTNHSRWPWLLRSFFDPFAQQDELSPEREMPLPSARSRRSSSRS